MQDGAVNLLVLILELLLWMGWDVEPKIESQGKIEEESWKLKEIGDLWKFDSAAEMLQRVLDISSSMSTVLGMLRLKIG
uniref:Uncharacterized protein n=1 Tax=Caenorhabditis brenneri TaxID=135651 RepID=B6VBE8_CAEBE|nr:hypothetical protein Cbre_JD07.008 [Caenorhabditis brenneri]